MGRQGEKIHNYYLISTAVWLNEWLVTVPEKMTRGTFVMGTHVKIQRQIRWQQLKKLDGKDGRLFIFFTGLIDWLDSGKVPVFSEVFLKSPLFPIVFSAFRNNSTMQMLSFLLFHILLGFPRIPKIRYAYMHACVELSNLEKIRKNVVGI